MMNWVLRLIRVTLEKVISNLYFKHSEAALNEEDYKFNLVFDQEDQAYAKEYIRLGYFKQMNSDMEIEMPSPINYLSK